MALVKECSVQYWGSNNEKASMVFKGIGHDQNAYKGVVSRFDEWTDCKKYSQIWSEKTTGTDTVGTGNVDRKLVMVTKYTGDDSIHKWELPGFKGTVAGGTTEMDNDGEVATAATKTSILAILNAMYGFTGENVLIAPFRWPVLQKS